MYTGNAMYMMPGPTTFGTRNAAPLRAGPTGTTKTGYNCVQINLLIYKYVHVNKYTRRGGGGGGGGGGLHHTSSSLN